jgi:hypothetical protein
MFAKLDVGKFEDGYEVVDTALVETQKPASAYRCKFNYSLPSGLIR